MRAFSLVAAWIGSLLMGLACTQSHNDASIARSPLARSSSEPSDADKSQLSATLSGFAFAVMQELRDDGTAEANFAFSPASLSLALGMAYAGAAGNTAAQMKTAMQVTGADDAYFRGLDWLDQQLEARADAALKQAQNQYTLSHADGPPPDASDYRLHVVNACWGDRTMTFEQPYLDTLATAFGTGVRLADFAHQPDAARLAISAWVSQETLDRIKDLIPSGDITSLTMAVLVNALHLKLPWSTPFLLGSTAPAPFITGDGSSVAVPFMNREGHLAYAEDDTTQAVAIPLSGDAIDFVVFLPKESSSLAQLEDALAQGHAQTLVASMSSNEVALALPKFSFTTPSLQLRSALMALGMTDAFDPNADFTAMTKAPPVFISDVVHKAMVAVDEHGIEAAAATAVIMTALALPTNVKQMNVNRPFFFGIYDRPTSTWLFLGQVTNPASS